MYFKPSMILLGACLIASPPLFAATPATDDGERSSQIYPAQRSQPTITFERMDADDNGELTRAEAGADTNLANHFSSIAGDDRISKSEYTAWVKTGSSGKATHKDTGNVAPEDTPKGTEFDYPTPIH